MRTCLKKLQNPPSSTAATYCPSRHQLSALHEFSFSFFFFLRETIVIILNSQWGRVQQQLMARHTGPCLSLSQESPKLLQDLVCHVDTEWIVSNRHPWAVPILMFSLILFFPGNLFVYFFWCGAFCATFLGKLLVQTLRRGARPGRTLPDGTGLALRLYRQANIPAVQSWALGCPKNVSCLWFQGFQGYSITPNSISAELIESRAI